MSAQASVAGRRGWCPGVRRPMETGDGLLVRLYPFGGRLTAHQVCLIAEAAREYGNGYLDITARGNLQIRGVSDQTYPDLLALLDREGLAEHEGDGPNRLTVVSPLAGLDPLDHCDALVLAQTIESKAGAVEGLPAKAFVSVDGGGSMPLDAIGADLHLLARDDAVAFGIASPNGLHWIGATSRACAPEAAIAFLTNYAAMRKERRTEARRLRELAPELARELAAGAALEPGLTPRPRPPAARAGLFDVGAGKSVLLALLFGRCASAQLAQAAVWSERFGAGEIRLSFTRGILLPRIAGRHLATLLDEARTSGFITEAQDTRLSLHACPGKPNCANALTHAPTDALRIAGACSHLLSQGATLHVSGCRKGCAYPSRANLTLVGRDDGRYDVITNGSASDAALLHLSVDELMTRSLPLDISDDPHRAIGEVAQ